MGKIKIKYADTPLPFTGERFTTSLAHSQIEAEHLHRYLIAKKFCAQKKVLDIACGEGYGSWILSQFASSVIGVDIDKATIEHASINYKNGNLNFVVGDVRSIPCDNESVDVVVSFETIEHVSEHRKFLHEIQRVLKPSGILIISSPDRNVYGSKSSSQNPYHILELSKEEFCKVTSEFFKYTHVSSQQSIIGSIVVPDMNCGEEVRVFERISIDHIEEYGGLLSSPYAFIIASNEEIGRNNLSLYFEMSEYAFIITEHKQARDEAIKLRDYTKHLEKKIEKLSNLEEKLKTEINSLQKIFSQSNPNSKEYTNNKPIDQMDNQYYEINYEYNSNIILEIVKFFLKKEDNINLYVKKLQEKIAHIEKISLDRAGAINHLEGLLQKKQSSETISKIDVVESKVDKITEIILSLK